LSQRQAIGGKIDRTDIKNWRTRLIRWHDSR
jgi:hypothetical protein